MKKVKVYKGFIIAEPNAKEQAEGKDCFEIYFKDEWEMGQGFRNSEWEAGSIKECTDFIDCYKQ